MAMKNRALAIAIAISGITHLFWMSVISVVIVPEHVKVSRFSRVSFLSPTISTRVIEVRMRGPERSFLEKRFSDHLERIRPKPSARSENEFLNDYFIVKETRMTQILIDSIAGEKSVPPPGFQD